MRRVVVTGMGAITPIGNDVETFWNGLKEKKLGFGPITYFDTTDYKAKLAAEVKDFEPKDYMDPKAARRMERFAQFATNVFDIPCGLDFEKTALAGIEAMEDFFRSIKMPVSLHELGLDLDDQQIHELAFKCSYEDTRTIGVFKQLNMKDMEKIYTMAR